jgi:RNA polymerase sigma-70 factor (ECF subfamily)
MSTLDYNNKLISFKQALQYFALSLTHNTEEAQDLLQDTMYKAVLYKDKFAESTNLKAWLYTIMKNTFINNYRKNVKTKQVVDNSKDLFLLNIPQTNSEVSPVSQISHKDISKVVSELEEDLRIPFLMYFEGYKYKEIADKYNLPIGTVKSRIFLARKKLMFQLKDFR